MPIGWGARSASPSASPTAAHPLAKALEEHVCHSGNVVEVIQYRVGPSVGAHTGPGTAGCFMFPA
jgi:fatty acid-binding protein DegV